MPDFELGLFVLLILGWIALVVSGVVLFGLLPMLPLLAVLILVNRLRPRRRAPANRSSEEIAKTQAAAR